MRIHSMFSSPKKPKQFDYTFRHYDPEEEERKKRRIEIKRTYKRRRKKTRVRSVAMLALGLAFVIWLIVWL